MTEPKRIGYADPPYPGQAAKHYSDHPDYAGEVDHAELLQRLDTDYDGWVLHTSSTALEYVLHLSREHGIGPYRVMPWVKPFAAFKRNIPVAYAWEPVLVKAARTPTVGGPTVMRDYIAESITMQRGLAGAKPERVCWWLFEVLGADPSDDLVDLYPGTGAVSAAWSSWCAQRPLTYANAPVLENSMTACPRSVCPHWTGQTCRCQPPLPEPEPASWADVDMRSREHRHRDEATR